MAHARLPSSGKWMQGALESVWEATCDSREATGSKGVGEWNPVTQGVFFLKSCPAAPMEATSMGSREDRASAGDHTKT